MSRPTLMCLVVVVAVAVVVLLSDHRIEATTNSSEAIRLKAILKPIGPCVLNSVFSFLYPKSYPPTTSEAMAEACRRHTESFKCIKDLSKPLPAILKRGILTFVSARQKVNKKFCTNLQGEYAKRVLLDFKCIMDKRFAHYKAIDAEFTNTLIELERRNYNDSARELKYFCCATYKFRRDSIEGVGNECASARLTMEEIYSSTVPSEINLICEDDDKLAKSCSELEPIKVAKEFDPSNSPSPSLTGLYLIATLGEAE